MLLVSDEIDSVLDTLPPFASDGSLRGLRGPLARIFVCELDIAPRGGGIMGEGAMEQKLFVAMEALGGGKSGP